MSKTKWYAKPIRRCELKLRAKRRGSVAIFLALALALSLSLVPAVPVGAVGETFELDGITFNSDYGPDRGYVAYIQPYDAENQFHSLPGQMIEQYGNPGDAPLGPWSQGQWFDFEYGKPFGGGETQAWGGQNYVVTYWWDRSGGDYIPINGPGGDIYFSNPSDGTRPMGILYKGEWRMFDVGTNGLSADRGAEYWWDLSDAGVAEGDTIEALAWWSNALGQPGLLIEKEFPDEHKEQYPGPDALDMDGNGSTEPLTFIGGGSSMSYHDPFYMGLKYAAVVAPPSEVWVDDDADTEWYDLTHFAAIQPAIDAVAEGGTVLVHPGIYNEAPRIDKALTVRSTDGAEQTTIDGTTTYIVIISHSDVTFEGFTVTNPDYATTGDVAGILVEYVSGEPVSNVQILDNIVTQVRSETGVASDYGSCGINIGNAPLSNIVISGNTITDIDNPEGAKLDDHTCGINIWDGADNVLISNNRILDIKYNGIILEHASNILIEDNPIITGCQTGIRVAPYEGVSVSGLTINSNNFADNVIQIFDGAAKVLNIQGVLDTNDFDRAVVINRPTTSLLHTIWSNIQDAIDAADPGDTINVAAGTYAENVDIPAGKDNLQIIGHSRDDTFVTIGSGLGFDCYCPVTIRGFDISGAGRGSGKAFCLRGGSGGTESNPGVFENNNCHSLNYGMTTGDWEPRPEWWQIKNNDFYNLRIGVLMEHSYHIEISGNTFKDYKEGVGMGWDCDTARYIDIIDNEFLGTTDTEMGAAILISSQAQEIQVLENEIRDSIIGVLIKVKDLTCPELVNVNINDNNIEGNTTGVLNESTEEVDAENNWWDSPNGPTHAGNTFNAGEQGDTVSDNVLYVPWLDKAWPDGMDFAPVTLDEPAGQFSSIQAAINAATGTTITCVAGTYTESISIDKSLTLQSIDGAEETTIQGTVTIELGWGSEEPLAETVFFGGEGSGFTVTGGKSGIYLVDITNGSSLSISGNIITECGCGIDSADDTIDGSSVTISGNQITDNGAGIYIGYVGGSTVDINGNTISGNTIGGILGGEPEDAIAFSSTVTISGNTITNNGIIQKGGGIAFIGPFITSSLTIEDNFICGNFGTWEPLDGFPPATGGVMVGGFFDESSLSITGNTIGAGTDIEGNPYLGNHPLGIFVGCIEFSSTAEIHHNDIAGNTEFGLYYHACAGDGSSLPEPVDATNNWWGDPSGPHHDPSNLEGEGDEVSDYVVFSPWLTWIKPPLTAELVTGWNTLSTPIALDKEHDQLSELGLVDNVIQIAWGFYFDESAGKAIWVQITTDVLVPCDAFYVNMNSPAHIDFVPSEELTEPPTKALSEGWNLVSLASLNAMPADEALISAYLVPGDFTGYAQVVSPSVNQVSWVYLREGEDAPDMLPTEGYWLFMNNAGTLAGFTFTPMS